MIGLLTVHLRLEACSSLKQKRSRIRPLISRLQRQFNLSVAEMGLQDHWHEALISCAMVGNEARHLRSALQNVEKWIEANWPDGMILRQTIELV